MNLNYSSLVLRSWHFRCVSTDDGPSAAPWLRADCHRVALGAGCAPHREGPVRVDNLFHVKQPRPREPLELVSRETS